MDELYNIALHAVKVYAVNVLIAGVIFVVGRWVASLLRSFVTRIMRKRSVDETLVKFTGSLIFAMLMVVVIIAALGQLGIETTSLVAILGAAGLAIGLALQGSLSNFAAGIMLIVFRPFRAGDFIEAAGVTGSVTAVQIFTTTLLTPDNKRVIIPNAKLAGDTITNFSAEDKRRIDLVFSIAYHNDIKRARDVMMDVLRSDARILAEPEPTVGVLQLADSAVNFAVRPWVHTVDYWAVYFDVMEKMKLRLEAEGFSIPFPQREVRVVQDK